MSEPSAPGVRELIDAIVAIGSDLELEALLRRIVESVTALVGARYGALGVLDESRTRLAQFITTGIDAETRAAIGHLPDGHGILGLLIVDPRPLRLADLSRHPDAGGFPPHHPPMTSFLGVPIRLRDRVFGNLYLTDKLTAAEFSALDEELAVGLAGAAAVAIEHARLYTQVQDLTLTADRDRIARDLHDTVIQRLFATGLALQATSRLVRADPDAARDRIERAVDELDGTVRQIRTAIFGLGSASPTVGAGLRERVLTVASDAARPLGFHPAVTFEGVIDANVDDGLAREVLAALREALTNVARHAHASRCAIVVRVHDQELTLEVIDDGVGPGRRDGAGRGLRNLAVRAEQRHGTFELVPGPDGGTAARWTVPLAPRAR